VELAISLMIILMLLLGAVEISLALFQYVTIRDAAQEGAVYGSIEPDDEAGIQFRAAAAASDVLNIDPTAVEVKINDKSVTDAVASNDPVKEYHPAAPHQTPSQ
jgi:Flp pilus assembly protein TadG